jgi:hypothetical protein
VNKIRAAVVAALLLCPGTGFSQHMDTLAVPEVTVSAEMPWKTTAEYFRYYRMKYRIESLRPLVDTILVRLDRVDDTLSRLATADERRRFIRRVEDREVPYFTPIISGMSRQQGLVFMKVLTRQAGESCYALIRHYKSKSACLKYLMLAKLSFIDLKSSYQPDDPILEQAMRAVYGK